MGNSQDNTEDDNSQEQAQGDQARGHSGEGAASAMQQLISQNRQHRHQAGEAGDAAGTGHGQ